MPVIGKSSLDFIHPNVLKSVKTGIVPDEAKAVTHQKQTEKAATDFEALLLQQMFQTMWNSVPQEGMLSGSKEETQFRDMLNEALAKSIAENQSIGIKDVLVKDMRKVEEK